METAFLLDRFQKGQNSLDQKKFSEKNLEISTVEILDSVCLKIYKNSWSNTDEDALTAESRMFFSIWISTKIPQQEKIFYNIHALKLRKLKGYKIESKKFANSFRNKFNQEKNLWQNVSTDFGPLTLMEGWVKFDEKKVQEDILKLANQFLEIQNLIDETLEEFRKN